MIPWTDRWKTGEELVDSQHEILIEKLNELGTLLEGPPPSKRRCDDLLDFLEAHVVAHFVYEEDCMHRARCPAHERNKKAHKAFIDIFTHYKVRYDAEGPTAEVLGGLYRAACDWTGSHILTVDVQLRRCIAAS